MSLLSTFGSSILDGSRQTAEIERMSGEIAAVTFAFPPGDDRDKAICDLIWETRALLYGGVSLGNGMTEMTRLANKALRALGLPRPLKFSFEANVAKCPPGEFLLFGEWHSVALFLNGKEVDVKIIKR